MKLYTSKGTGTLHGICCKSKPGTAAVLIDRYLTGKEVEVDAICDGETVVIPGIMEHIERAGVHSGDSIAKFIRHKNIWEKFNDLADYTTCKKDLK